MVMREMLEKGFCPRCGQKYSYIERREQGNNVYLLAVHVTRENKKRHVRKCYLGPESDYIYVSYMHPEEGLQLKGMLNRDRALEYLRALRNYFRNEKMDDSMRRQLSEIGKELIEIAGIEEGNKEEIRISKEELEDMQQYFIARKTKGMSKERMSKTKELFKKVFSQGKRIIVVE